MADQDLSTVLRGNNVFSYILCKKLQASNKNTFYSPTNIFSILTLMLQDPWFLNKQEYFNELFKIYNVRMDTSAAAEHYKDMVALLHVGDDVSVASKAFVKINHELLEVFRTRLTDNFLYDVNHINFDNSEDAANMINNWVKDNTFEKAKMDSASLDGGSRVTLLNAIHFSSKWTLPFNREDTVLAPFHVSDNETIDVQMMKKTGEFYYKQDILSNSQILELPFVNSHVSLVVVLPSSKAPFGFWDNTYGAYDMTTQITENMVLKEVDVSLPKFTIEENLELKQQICELGLSEAFNANLFEVLNGEDITLSKVQQRAFISVNEEGSETAAGTMSNLNAFREDEKDLSKDGILINEMNINTNISNRYAKTKVVWKLRNVKKHANTVNFKVVLTETAFITGFVMEVEEKSYKSYIKEKEVAKSIYNAALAQGTSAGLVEATARDSKEFTVSVNIEPEPDIVATFTLTYEEMLVRVHDQYELVLNICPGQIVPNVNVEVQIAESRPLSFVKTPPLRTGNDISVTKIEKYLEPSTEIQMKNSKTAVVRFRPDIRAQRKFAHYLNQDVSNGMSAQFVLRYDVEREPHDGEVLLRDGYFVHYLAPNDLDPLAKHVVFVLDTSGSMGGQKIFQLKGAMASILGEIRKNDLINIIEFNSYVRVWDINTVLTFSTLPEIRDMNYQEPFYRLSEFTLPDPTYATEQTINTAKAVVERMCANGGTYIIGALQTALYLVKRGQEKSAGQSEKCQPIIVFLTDGQPNVGLHSTEEIVNTVTSNNKNIKVPIFSLSFGNGADKNFLRKLSLKNHGFSRHIYEASDASLQLQEFYKQISSPLLADIKFKYESEVEEVTRTYFPIYFRGSELVVCGRYRGSSFPTLVHCWGPMGPITIKSTVEMQESSLERLWAYLSVKQLLEERDLVDDKIELTRKAVALALKYSFVTDVTSLVVVKPTETNTLSTDNNPTLLQCPTGPALFASASPVNYRACLSAFGSMSKMKMCAFGAPPPMFQADMPTRCFGGGGGGANSPQPQIDDIIRYSSRSSGPMVTAQSFGFGGSPSPQQFGACQTMATAQSFGFGGSPSAQQFGASQTMFTAQSFGFGGSPSPQQFGACQSFSSNSSGGFLPGPYINTSATATGQNVFGIIGPPSQQPFGLISQDITSDQFLGTPEDYSLDSNKKRTEFLANRPFLIFLKFKKDDKIIILFQGRVCKPH